MKPHKHIESLAVEAKALADSKIIRGEEARALLNLLQRLIETLARGEPSTAPISRHHG